MGWTTAEIIQMRQTVVTLLIVLYVDFQFNVQAFQITTFTLNVHYRTLGIHRL